MTSSTWRAALQWTACPTACAPGLGVQRFQQRNWSGLKTIRPQVVAQRDRTTRNKKRTKTTRSTRIQTKQEKWKWLAAGRTTLWFARGPRT